MLIPVEFSEAEKRGHHQLAAYCHFQFADEQWSNELRRLFSKNAGNIRYTKQGEGKPGTLLRQLHDNREAARKAWNAAYGRE